MAGGIDWFRWHHGSVTDPKFQLVARKAGASLPDVLAVWAFLLEKASAAEFRGCFGDVDVETVDCLFGFDDGRTDAILAQLVERKLIADEFIVAWEKRQTKREREGETSTERVRAHRAMKRHETPGNTTDDPETPRGEESREEQDISTATQSHPPTGGLAAGFAEFWEAWPKGERKHDKAKCLEHWKRNHLGGKAHVIAADIAVKRTTQKWADGFCEAPLVYLRGKRWEDGVEPEAPKLTAAAITVPSKANESTAALLAEQSAHAALSQSPEATAARIAAMAKLNIRRVTA